MNYKLLLGATALSLTVLANAQDLTHPTEMNLPDYNFVRPDPADFQHTLGNGLTAYVAPATQVPLVTMSAFVRAGKVDDAQQGAVEALVAALKRGGSTDQLAVDFSSSLERMTAEYDVNLHDEWLEISLNVPSEDLTEAVGLFFNIILNPGISQTAIDIAAASAAPGGADLGGESGPALYEGSLNATWKNSMTPFLTNIPMAIIQHVRIFRN